MILSVPAHFFENKKYHQIYKPHSTYKHTQNYEHNGEIISIHDKSRIASPMAIVLDYEEMAFDRLKDVLTTIIIEKNAIRINDVLILRSEVRLSQHDVRQLVAKNRALVRKQQNILTQVIKDELLVVAPPMSPELTKRVGTLILSLRENEGLLDALRALIGYGEGLTPSGDDIVCGLLAGLLYVGLEKQFEATATIVRSIIQKTSVTSTISRSFLSYGIEGLFIETLVELYEKLWANQPIGELITQIAALGHRSGTDYLKGLLLGIQLGGSDYDS